MKTSARFLAMLLAVVMIAGAALSVSAFEDVTGAVEHATAINVLAQLGVIGGYEDGTFKPTQNVTRAEMAKLVYVLYTTFTDAGEGTVKFDDVKGHWATGYISWCASKNIIGGYGDGNFGPNDNVTYDQALKMVAGTLGYNEWDSNQWPTDVRMKALNDLNLGEDMPETVKGKDNLTRAQVAQIMYNALQAEMNETKSTTEYITSDDGAKIPFTFPVAKKLAVDVWKFTKVTYTVKDANEKNDVTTLTLGYTETVKGEDGKDKDVAKTEEYKLAELGLEAYEGKTDDLIGLELVGLRKGKEVLGVPSLLGTIKDEVKVSFKDSKKSITIDGIEYEEEDFIKTKDNTVIAITVNGNAVDPVFVKDTKSDAMILNDKITKALMPNSQYLARTIDVQGDGEIDQLIIVPKTACRVEKVKTAKGVTTVTLKTLAGDKFAEVDAKNINIELAEKDIVVAAQLGASVYAEKVEATTTYATRLNTTAKKVTLNNVGEVIYEKQTVAGVDLTKVKLSTADLGSDNTDTYYIYNGEVLLKEKVNTESAYTFAILRYIEESTGEVDKVSMTKKTSYTANILVLEDGKLVEKTLPISEKVAKSTFEGKTLLEAFPVDYEEDVKISDEETKKVIVYNYALITSYEEDKDGYYDLVIEDLFDEDKTVAEGETAEYVIVNAETFKYTAKTKIYSVGTVYNKVKVNDDSVIFYKDKLTTTAAKGFTDMKFYTKDSLTTKDFEVKADIAVLAKDDSGRYNLLALIAEKAIKGSTGKVADYTTDGRLVLFAPEGSNIELVDGKNYNSYIFMDNATLEIKDAAIDTTTEWNEKTNKGTEAGYFYGYDTTSEKYVPVYKSTGLETIVSTKLTDVLLEEELIEFTTATGKELINVSSDVIIWGLTADEGKYDEFTQFTLAELAEMFELVDDYNEDNKENTDVEQLDIDIIMTSYYDSNDDLVLASVIVEVFEADEDDSDIVNSVNAGIFTNFNK